MPGERGCRSGGSHPITTRVDGDANWPDHVDKESERNVVASADLNANHQLIVTASDSKRITARTTITLRSCVLCIERKRSCQEENRREKPKYWFGPHKLCFFSINAHFNHHSLRLHI